MTVTARWRLGAKRWPLAALLIAGLCPSAARAADFSELVLRGFGQLQAARLEEAVASFEQALELEPSSAPARKGLAAAAAALGATRVRGGRLREGRTWLEKATEAQPEDAGYHLQLAQVIFRSADAAAARREVDRALELAPGSAAAHELSGDLHAREGLLNLALGEWEVAARAGNTDYLAEKIARGRREMAAEEGMGRESSRYFIILYEREVPRALVQEFFEELDRSFDTLHDRLGEYPRDPITVLLYAKTAFAAVTRAAEWVGGTYDLYDGKIRVPVGGLTTAREAAGLQATLLHEMTHAFVHRMAPVGLPLWFHEGLAKAVEGWDPERVRAWFKEHPPEGLTSLAAVDRALQGRGGDVAAGYAAARLAVADLEEIRGQGATRRIIAGVGAGESFAEVFREEMRLDLEEFQARWAKGLR